MALAALVRKNVKLKVRKRLTLCCELLFPLLVTVLLIFRGNHIPLIPGFHLGALLNESAHFGRASPIGTSSSLSLMSWRDLRRDSSRIPAVHVTRRGGPHNNGKLLPSLTGTPQEATGKEPGAGSPATPESRRLNDATPWMRYHKPRRSQSRARDHNTDLVAEDCGALA